MGNPRRPQGGNDQQPKKKKKRSFRWLLYLFLLLFGMGLGAAGLVANYVYEAYQTLPAFEDFDPSVTSYIYDSQGREVYKLAAEENRTPVRISEIPKEVQDAFTAVEDNRFREHFGIDLVGITRATWKNVLYFTGRHNQLEGASTITQQLVKLAYLTPDQTVFRKVQEMLIAIQLERRYTKDEILERYLNQIYFNNSAYGLQAAAQTYFQKDAKDLTVQEGAFLAGIIKFPSRYDPFTNYDDTALRYRDVLMQMAKYEMLDPDTAETYKDNPPPVHRAAVTPQTTTFTGDHFVDYVLRVLTDSTLHDRYGVPLIDDTELFRRGLKIYTTLDLDMQRVADEQVKEIIPEASEEWGIADAPPQAAVVMLDPKTGHVKALVGGTSHMQMRELNRATDTLRQPGSTIKPIVSYAPAIDLLGWGPSTVIDDSPPMISPDKTGVWPENYDFLFHGLQPMRFAVEQSQNAMAVRTMMAVTPRKGIEYAKKMGITTLVEPSMNAAYNDENLALTLGGVTNGISLLEMTSAFGTIANMGVHVEPVVITRIENRFGEVIYQAPPRKRPVLKEESAYLMIDVMKGVFARGTAHYESKGFNGWPAGGKTGTTEDWADAWFIGFTPDLVTGVWNGYDNDEGKQVLPRKSNGVWWTGAGPPVRLWTGIMNEVVTEAPQDWARPQNIVNVQICRTSGLLPSPLCPPGDIITDMFIKGTEPTQYDNVWTMANVAKQEVPHGDPNLAAQGITQIRWALWQTGCEGAPESHLFIKRPTTYARHPSNPFAYRSDGWPRYLPKDWLEELPTEMCQPQPSQPSGGIITLPVLPPGGGDTVTPPDPPPPATDN